MDMEQQLSDFERDQLKEVMNIGAANASTALSQLLGKRVRVYVPDAFVDRIEKVVTRLGDSEQAVTTVLVKFLGDAPGVIMLLFPPTYALNLVNILTHGNAQDIHALDELERSALREVGNILAGSALAALGKFSDLQLVQSLPEDKTDMLGSIMDSVLVEIGVLSDRVLVFRAFFAVEEEHIEGQLFFLFDTKSTAKILEITRHKVSG